MGYSDEKDKIVDYITKDGNIIKLILIPVKIIDSTIAHNAFFLKKRIALLRNILIRD